MHNENDKNVCRITLKAVEGSDTDWVVAKGLLNEAMGLTQVRAHNNRMFIGGDQKTMNIALSLKEYWPKEIGLHDLRKRISIIPQVSYCQI